MAMPAWPAPRPREDDPTAPRAIETAAEVFRVRRVARFLAFATLRPLAPIRVLESDETNGLNPETNGSNPNPNANPARRGAGDTKRHELSLPAGTELQLIAGRTLLERVRGGEAAAESHAARSSARRGGAGDRSVAGEPAAAHRRRRGVDGGFRGGERSGGDAGARDDRYDRYDDLDRRPNARDAPRVPRRDLHRRGPGANGWTRNARRSDWRRRRGV